jgi:hypothetical protein
LGISPSKDPGPSPSAVDSGLWSTLINNLYIVK